MNSRRLLLYLPPFIVLAVLNSGGYRYGASDQAFYLPVIFAKLDPGLYVRDAAVIAAQARLTIYDEAMAAIVRATGVSIPVLFAVLHVISLVLVATGVWLVAKRIYRTEWALCGTARRDDAAPCDRAIRDEHSRGIFSSAPTCLRDRHRRDRDVSA